VVFKLNLPKDSRLYPVFHAALLETAPQQVPIQTTLQTQNEQEYEVEEILDVRQTSKGQEYLVSWKGYSMEENSWEPEGNLQNCQQAINSYHRQHPEAPMKTNQRTPLHRRRKKEMQRTQAPVQAVEHLTAQEVQSTLASNEESDAHGPQGSPTAYEGVPHEPLLQEQPSQLAEPQHEDDPVQL